MRGIEPGTDNSVEIIETAFPHPPVIIKYIFVNASYRAYHYPGLNEIDSTHFIFFIILYILVRVDERRDDRSQQNFQGTFSLQDCDIVDRIHNLPVS